MLLEPHNHRIEGYPVRMTPTTKPNIGWRCRCGAWQLCHSKVWNETPATDETIRIAWLERLSG